MRLKLLKTDEGTQSSRGNHSNKEIFTEIFSFYGLKWKIRFSGPHRVRDALVPSKLLSGTSGTSQFQDSNPLGGERK